MNAKKNQPKYNVDYEEIAKFERMASYWWNPEDKLKALHRINSLRLSYIMERSGGLFNKNVLDVGCGGGLLAEGMAHEGANVTGLEISFKLLEVARLHALKSDVQIVYIQETVEEYAEKHPQQYDIITCMEILEHTPDPQSIINSCSKLIKLGGHVFFSTINRNVKAWLIAVLGAEYLLRMIPMGTHDVKKFIKPAELLNWVDQTCLKEQEITGLNYNPLLDRFNLSSCIDINYLLHTKAI